MPRSLRLTALGLLLMPTAAFAEGMPQLNFSNPLTVDQVGWGAVIFLILFLLCWRWALPKVASVLEQRAHTIAADLDTARAAKAEADRAIAEMNTAIARARADAQAAINAAVEKAKQEAAARSATLNERLEAQLKEAEGRIAAAQASAMRALRAVAIDAADTLIARLTGTAPDAARVERAVSTLLAARGQQ
ncbi:MAG TPA: F0F1 ATP synthase subunit B [Acetobacteraceae bacterium]|nr:F0F1 ATP synthase subunit B [Acetobacteraceae bacterium]